MLLIGGKPFYVCQVAHKTWFEKKLWRGLLRKLIMLDLGITN